MKCPPAKFNIAAAHDISCVRLAYSPDATYIKRVVQSTASNVHSHRCLIMPSAYNILVKLDDGKAKCLEGRRSSCSQNCFFPYYIHIGGLSALLCLSRMWEPISLSYFLRSPDLFSKEYILYKLLSNDPFLLWPQYSLIFPYGDLLGPSPFLLQAEKKRIIDQTLVAADRILMRSAEHAPLLP
jgi:hypothetical protein